MNKVYVLIEYLDADTKEIIGVVTNKKVAEAFFIPCEKNYIEFELNDIDLLNKITEENQNA